MGELHFKAVVQPGGRIEVLNEDLPVGESVDVIVRYIPEAARRSALDILDGGPGHRLFKSAEEVDAYLAEEKASWDDEHDRPHGIAALDESFEELSRDMGPRNWNREDLYDRDRKAREQHSGD